MATSLSRVLRFRASHHYRVPSWSDARNREAFGPLVESHPHDYTCTVTVTGAPDPTLGVAVDLPQFDRLLDREVRLPLDGKDLNRDLPAFGPGGRLPTCEALAEYLFARIAGQLPAGVRLLRVRIAEDPTLYAECTGLE
jgi:6-pyruvoyl-tetrahydropterin synthase